jgi:ribosomal protein S18 acetylase RimI-like enzyme
MCIILRATSPEHISKAKALVIEYTRALGIDLQFQGFERELDQFPAPYAPPGGSLLVALDGNQMVGLVGLKQLAAGICEMKRLYVTPAARGRNLGRKLAKAAMDEGRVMGYKTMRLDTLARMPEAGPLYKSLGFREIDAYYENPEADAVYMERTL